jgi:hypothetical protein
VQLSWDFAALDKLDLDWITCTSYRITIRTLKKSWISERSLFKTLVSVVAAVAKEYDQCKNMEDINA